MESANEMLRTIPEVVEDEEAIMNPPQLPSGAQPPKRLFTFQSLMRADPATQTVVSKTDLQLPGTNPTAIQQSLTAVWIVMHSIYYSQTRQSTDL